MKLSLSMPLTFNSKQIDKVVSIDDVGTLSNPEILLLKDELMIAINNMDDYIKKFKEEKQEDYDKDWHQKVRRKQQVCKAFLSQLIDLDHDESLFRAIYDKHFSQIILKYIDRNEFRTIHNKARSLAIAELEKIT
jgi:cell division protein ZapA (FtsZ GTPase activity inhibitor)